MTTFIFLLYSSFLAWNVANPEELVRVYIPVNKSDPTFQAWRSEATDRLQTTQASFLGLGLGTFILVVCFILFQDKLVSTTLSKFPLHVTSKDIVDDFGTDNKKDDNMTDQTSENHEGINAEL